MHKNAEMKIETIEQLFINFLRLKIQLYPIKVNQ